MKTWLKLGSLAMTLAFLAACSSGLQTATPDEESSLATQATTLSYRVPNSASDAEEGSAPYSYLPSTVLELGVKEGDGPQLTGLRFTGVNIPKGAVITSAYIEFKAVASASNSTSLKAYGIAESNTLDFSSSNSTISARPKTASQVTWNPGSWTGGNTYKSASLISIVKEITNRSDWAAGKAMGFVVTGTGGTRRAAAYDGSSAAAPKLVVTYDLPQPPPLRSCLNGSVKPIERKGIYTTPQVIREQTNAQVNAHGGRFLAPAKTGHAFQGARNKETFCLSGGTYNIGLPANAPWDDRKSADGKTILEYGYHGHEAIYFESYDSNYNPKITVEGVAVENTGDGVTFKDNADGWVFRDSYVKRAGDDGVENDRVNNGTVDNILIDSAFAGLSCQQERPTTKYVNFTVQNSLIALRDTPRYSHNNFFKMLHAKDNNAPSAGGKHSICKWYLKDNVILLEHYRSGDYMNPNGSRDGGVPIEDNPLQESACVGHKNTIVYVGGITADFDRLKKASPTCYTVTDQVKVWDDARAAWFNNHPEFAKYR